MWRGVVGILGTVLSKSASTSWRSSTCLRTLTDLESAILFPQTRMSSVSGETRFLRPLGDNFDNGTGLRRRYKFYKCQHRYFAVTHTPGALCYPISSYFLGVGRFATHFPFSGTFFLEGRSDFLGVGTFFWRREQASIS